jgi:Fic family protein
MRNTGTYQTLGSTDYFIPHALPPSNPPLELSAELMSLYGEAVFALGQLNEMSLKLPDTKRFIKAYVIKEALLSSAIEGIHTTLIDVFTSDVSDMQPNKDTQLIVNYVEALEVALDMLQKEDLPIVSRVILNAHKTLLSGGEGDKANPGSYRQQSVRVGNLVPPPAPEIPILIRDLERYINEPSDLPPLIRSGLAHVQFETIHPFLDGNGRIGRLLIVLMLIDNQLLGSPIIYPSYYFKKHHMEYYTRLDAVRTKGDFEGWITYYLQGIRDSALDAYKRAKEIEALDAELRNVIQTDSRFVKMRETAMLVLAHLFTQPVTTVAELSKSIDKAYNTSDNILQHFIALGVVADGGTHKRSQLYRFDRYLQLLEKGY